LPLAEILPISDVTESENLQRRQSLSKPLHLAGQTATTKWAFRFSPGAWHVPYFPRKKIGDIPISECKSVGKASITKKIIPPVDFLRHFIFRPSRTFSD